MNPHQPKTLEELYEKMYDNSSRNDFSDQYRIENNLDMPYIGEYAYGASFTPTDWVLPYLHELKVLRKKVEVYEAALHEVKDIAEDEEINAIAHIALNEDFE